MEEVRQVRINNQVSSEESHVEQESMDSQDSKTIDVVEARIKKEKEDKIIGI